MSCLKIFLCIKYHKSDPPIKRKVDPSFVRINQDQLVGGELVAERVN